MKARKAFVMSDICPHKTSSVIQLDYFGLEAYIHGDYVGSSTPKASRPSVSLKQMTRNVHLMVSRYDRVDVDASHTVLTQNRLCPVRPHRRRVPHATKPVSGLPSSYATEHDLSAPKALETMRARIARARMPSNSAMTVACRPPDDHVDYPLRMPPQPTTCRLTSLVSSQNRFS
jgi:hypothetical protein